MNNSKRIIVLRTKTDMVSTIVFKIIIWLVHDLTMQTQVRHKFFIIGQTVIIKIKWKLIM